MKDCEEIYLIGPGADKNSFDISILENKTTLNFSGDLVWFSQNNIYPTYWTFLDPNSTLYIFDRYHNGKYNPTWFRQIVNHTSIIYNDFQGTDKFYDYGFSTSRGKHWNRENFGKRILPELCNIFKEIIVVPSIVTINSFDSFYEENTKDLVPVVLHEDYNLNTDKLTCFVLPLVLAYFKNIRNIKCIGFGDFTSPREYNNSILGYDGYMVSYQKIKQQLINLLKYKGVKVEFNNKNSYFIELENA